MKNKEECKLTIRESVELIVGSNHRFDLNLFFSSSSS